MLGKGKIVCKGLEAEKAWGLTETERAESKKG